MLNHPPPQQALPLTSGWEFRLDGEAEWRAVPVPGCWEQIGVRKDLAGPAWYRLRFEVPAAWAGKRLWLQFGGVSYHCDVYVNSKLIGSHTGLWDAFALEITDTAAAGAAAELTLRVEKPAGLAAGPDSARLPGRFALRETLVGFLPYVWGQIFGGIWQDVALVASGATVFEDIRVQGAADGRVQIEVATSAPAAVAIEMYSPSGALLTAKRAKSAKKHEPKPSASSALFAVEYVAHFEMTVRNPQPWSPDTPALYEARLAIADGDERVVRFGLRTLRADGSTILLNQRPIYPRMALSWGWYPDALHSNPGPDRVRADFARLKRLGYNGVKLCLWFPPQYYFDLADELGMLLWVELPMWIPQPSAFFRAQVPVEYERLMRLARGHPSVIIYTLGCELSRVVDAQLLAPLFALVKRHAGDALVRDNSGSGEAYGGLLDEYAEFYDHHFYAELQHFRGLLDSFAPRGRAPQPWLFGEFCDYDTFRDPGRLQNQEPRTKNQVSAANEAIVLGSWFSGSNRFWWMLDDPELNPQGARWQFDVPYHEQRLRANGLWGRGSELERKSEGQGLWHRKYTLELVRLYGETSGYVVTGEADTPISTAGMWDHSDRLKFDPAEFRGCNADLILLAGWDRRRDWVAGGDRAAPWDTWNYTAGATVRAHLIASHYGRARGPAQVRWNVRLIEEAPFAQGHASTAFELTPGDIREVTVAEFTAPWVSAPRQAVLEAEVAIGGEQARNRWPLWFFPRGAWADSQGIALHDPLGRLGDLKRIAPAIHNAQDKETGRQGDLNSDTLPLSHSPTLLVSQSTKVMIATAWTPELHSFVRQGGRAILLQPSAGPPGPLPTVAQPFWREATRLAAPHPAWGDFPLDDALASQLFGCATDHALDMRAFDGEWRPILRRVDTRTMQLTEYALEISVGRGTVIVSTLRFEGGQGVQPLGIARNTAAAYLLWCWARYLRDR